MERSMTKEKTFLEWIIDLQSVAHSKGLGNILPEGYEVDCTLELIFWDDGRIASDIPESAAEASIAWWIRDFCQKHGDQDVDHSKYKELDYFAWASEIVAKSEEK